MTSRTIILTDQLHSHEKLPRQTVNLADAKAHLSALVEQAVSGVPVRIIRRGKPVAQITAIRAARARIDAATSRALTDRMPMQPESAGSFLRTARDAERS